jgi:hypothetical protein
VGSIISIQLLEKPPASQPVKGTKQEANRRYANENRAELEINDLGDKVEVGFENLWEIEEKDQRKR